VIDIAEGIHSYKRIEGWMKQYKVPEVPISQEEVDKRRKESEAEGETKKDN
jgi:hypothetical protein